MAVTPTCPVRYDPLDEATLADPYPVLAALRAHAPLVWHDTMECWLVTGYDDCVRVLRDHESFARDPRRLHRVVPEASLSVQVLDPPHQAAVRSAFMTSLHAQDLPALQERARRDIAARLEVLASRPAWDVMRELAQPVALNAIADLLGVSPPPLSAWVEVSDTIMRSMDGGLNPGLVEPGRRAREELSNLVASWFTATGSTAGLLGHVRARTADSGPELGRYVVHTARVMFQGGYSTLAAAIGNSVDTLVRNLQVQRSLREAPQLRATGVDELIRYDGPVQGTSRLAVSDVLLGGTTVHRGETVTVLFQAANRDPAYFEHPDRLVLDRSPNRHLGYGWGTHACLGTRVAQRVLVALVDALVDQPGLLQAAGVSRRRNTATMRAFDQLPVTFQP
ncbi:cytochrome P450 [Streptomyces sp. NPDC051452]|uniref:cytochrome P450 n=1 Tax=Streptomyces sp. NPDC051452 TaxID=3365654 RepID=UPI0037B71348